VVTNFYFLPRALLTPLRYIVFYINDLLTIIEGCAGYWGVWRLALGVPLPASGP